MLDEDGLLLNGGSYEYKVQLKKTAEIIRAYRGRKTILEIMQEQGIKLEGSGQAAIRLYKKAVQVYSLSVKTPSSVRKKGKREIPRSVPVIYQYPKHLLDAAARRAKESLASEIAQAKKEAATSPPFKKDVFFWA